MTEHIQHVRAVLQQLNKYQLYAKENNIFHRTATSFLRYTISAEGDGMDDSKVQAVLNWPQPHNSKGAAMLTFH